MKPTKNNLKKFYNEKYPQEEIKRGITPEIFRRLIDIRAWIQDKKVKTVLDAGCSRGYLSQIIAHKELYGIDVSKTLLKKVNGYKEIKEASVLKIPYPDNCFDLVVCMQVIEHVPDWKKAIKELVRVSKNYILISTDFVTKSNKENAFNPFENVNGHIHQFSVNKFLDYCHELKLSKLQESWHYPLLEFSTLPKKGGLLNKLLRHSLLYFNRILNHTWKSIYNSETVRCYNDSTRSLNNLQLHENLFKRYSKYIDLEVEIAFLFSKN